jgi:hypothetical protein
MHIRKRSRRGHLARAKLAGRYVTRPKASSKTSRFQARPDTKMLVTAHGRVYPDTRFNLVTGKASRRGGRVVECTALEMRHRGNSIGGSNPSLSAIYAGFRGNATGCAET